MARAKTRDQNDLIKPISVAVVGLGHWGPNLARVVHENPNSLLSWCCDLDENRLKKIKAVYPYIKTTCSLSDVLRDKTVNALIIAVPASSHYDIVKAALKARKDVLVEKPLTTSQKEALDLIAFAKRRKRILMVDHTFVFNPGIQKIKKLIKAHTLGKIHYGYGDYTALGPIRDDVSAVWDLATHFLYTICYLLDSQPISISASGRAFLTKEITDVAFLNLEFADGTLFNLRVSWADPVKTRTMVLVGNKKMVKFDDGQADGKVIIYDRGIKEDENQSFLKHFFTFRYGDIVFPHIPTNEPLAEVFQCFLKAIKTRKLKPLSYADFVNLVTILEAAQYSLSRNHKVINFLLNERTKFIAFNRRLRRI